MYEMIDFEINDPKENISSFFCFFKNGQGKFC